MIASLVELANRVAALWSAWMAAALLDSTVLLVLVSLVWWAIHKRVAPQVGYCLFLLVPLKLLVPVQLTVPPTVARWIPSACVSSWLAEKHEPDGGASLPVVDRPPSAIPAERPPRIVPPVASQPPTAPITKDSLTGNLPATPGSVAATATPLQAPATAGPEMPPLTTAAVLMLVWLLCVLFLSVRLLRVQFQFRARLKKLAAVDPARLAIDLGELQKRAGVSRAVRILESEDVTAPAVWGLLRATIILPRGIASSLTAPQLQWAVLHELAHLRRHDLAMVVLQRCACVLHFFNPAVWAANRTIHRLREYACDDLAATLSNGPAVESGEAFVQILKHACNGRRALDGALGMFGLDSRTACLIRARRLLEAERPIRTQLGPWALAAFLLAAGVVLPQLRAGAEARKSESRAVTVKEPAAAQPKPEAVEKVALARDTGEFELRVVGPDGKPVPGVRMELRGNPLPTVEQIRRGTFVRKYAYGTFVNADAEGRLVVKLPTEPKRFQVNITAPGFGPYWAGWTSETHEEPLPARFTAELEAGWSVGGIIVDDQGQPVAGVSVDPSIAFKKRTGDSDSLHIGEEAKTDAAGKWRFDSVPVSTERVWVEIRHADFMPNRRDLSRQEFGLELKQEPTVRIAMSRGLTVTGKVTDEKGAPIAAARVHTRFANDRRETKTAKDGTYRLGGCEPKLAKIVVSARGMATDMQQVQIEPEMEPVNFEMKPGGKIRIRVLDENGKPVPKARIFFQRWRGDFFGYFEFDGVNQYADEKGVWEWNEAPLDEFKADICPPDGMQLGSQPLIARDEEYVFRTQPALVISGKVVDAETKKPIEKFTVTPGARFDASHKHWSQNERFAATRGKYQIRHVHDAFAHLVRIEAAGYQAALSRDIQSNEGRVSIDFELQRAADIAATVLTPEGKPATKAEVAVGIGGSQINVFNGTFGHQTYATKLETDESGRFHFPSPDAPFQLVIVHPAGFAHVKDTLEGIPEEIMLKGWARVTGTFRVGSRTAPNAPLSIDSNALHSYGKDAPSIFTHHETTTDKEGRFVFERVIPGKARIGRQMIFMVEQGATEVTSACLAPANFPAGETTELELGGTGRPVIGRLRTPEGFAGKVNWRLATIFAQVQIVEPPGLKQPAPPADVQGDSVKTAAWWREWQQTPEGKAWTNAMDGMQRLRDITPFFRASAGPDGTFRIDDMPAGVHSISVRLDGKVRLSLPEHRFTIKPIENGRSDEPLDMGDLTLEN
jgi:beta-lactamase regulating signal transducer with metallopeptidase domain/protocatechuate 3,4-dioxygenase beta subunit